LDQEVREGEANVMIWFAWLVAAQRWQQRAAELAAAAIKNGEAKTVHHELDVFIGTATVRVTRRRETSRWRSWRAREGPGRRPVARRRPYRAVPGGDSPFTVALPPFSNSTIFAKLLLILNMNLKNSQDMKSLEFQALQVLY
jgi:hypothetical protein